jgi:hypothetical protein
MSDRSFSGGRLNFVLARVDEEENHLHDEENGSVHFRRTEVVDMVQVNVSRCHDNFEHKCLLR